jgi:hypothetical protein
MKSRYVIASLFCACAAYPVPIKAAEITKRDRAIESDMLPISLKCPEGKDGELVVNLTNRYLDEIMYYIRYRDDEAVEIGLRFAQKGQPSRWLKRAKKAQQGFGPGDMVFAQKTQRKAEPILKAGCSGAAEQRQAYADELKRNEIKMRDSAIPDPDAP